jgi:hypothetical protein
MEQNKHTAAKRRLGLFLIATLLVGMLTVPASAADIYFTAINDNVPLLTADTMPFWSGGTLYVPYSVFDSSSNGGIDLGLYCIYDRTANQVTLYNIGRPMLVFDLNTGACWDELSGETFSARAISRNNRPYLPLAMVCNYFDLGYSYNAIPYVNQGYLVRIKSDAASLSDARFIDAASYTINLRLRDYNQSLTPATDAAPATPSTPATTTQPTTPAVTEEEDPTDIPTYLAFRCTSGGGLSSILDTLDANSRCAVFFLTPELLQEEDGLVRRILGSGHSVGILAEGATAEETRSLLSEGTRLLAELTFTHTTLAYVPKDQRDTVAADGWICWKETIRLSPSGSVSSSTFASNALRRLSGRTRNTYLTLDGTQNSARVLSTFLRQLESKNFVLNIPLETRI